MNDKLKSIFMLDSYGLSASSYQVWLGLQMFDIKWFDKTGFGNISGLLVKKFCVQVNLLIQDTLFI